MQPCDVMTSLGEWQWELKHQATKSTLRDSLALALEDEHYELAAQLRDQIENL